MHNLHWGFLAAAPFPDGTLVGTRLHARLARDSDMESVYALGYDVWGEGMEFDQYLLLCKSSAKYKKGTWVVFSEGTESLPIVALICYRLIGLFDITVIGIGSVATNSSDRNQSFATEALKLVLDVFDEQYVSQLLVLFPDSKTSVYSNVGFEFPPLTGAASRKTCPMYYRTKQGNQKDTDRVVALIHEVPYF